MWILFFPRSKFIPPASPTGLNCSVSVNPSTRSWYLTGGLQRWRRSSPSAIDLNSSDKQDWICFAQFYTNAGISWCFSLVCNMVRLLCFGCWAKKTGFRRSSGVKQPIDSYFLLYRYICYILSVNTQPEQCSVAFIPGSTSRIRDSFKFNWN